MCCMSNSKSHSLKIILKFVQNQCFHVAILVGSFISITIGLDYESDTKIVMFEPGVTSTSVRYVINNDAIAEGQESFNLLLSSTDPTVNVPLGSDVVTVNIDDTDSKFVSV